MRKPISLEQYLRAHHGHMKRFRGDPNLELAEEVRRAPQLVIIEGRAVICGGVGVTYDKSLTVVGRRGDGTFLWMTSTYRYNAHIIGAAPVIRYDNGNGEKHYPDHPTAHHKHLFDWRQMAQDRQVHHLDGYPCHTGPMEYPTLAAFFDEVCDWVEGHRSMLPRPDWMPDLSDVQPSYL